MKKIILSLVIISMIILAGCASSEVKECASSCLSKSKGSDIRNDPKQITKNYCELYCEEVEKTRGSNDVNRLTEFFNELPENCGPFIAHVSRANMEPHDELQFACAPEMTNHAILYGGTSSTYLPEKELKP